MKVVKPSVKVFFFKPESGHSTEELIEWIGRTCYQSQHKIGNKTHGPFIDMVRKRGHHAMLEFGYAVAIIIADRGHSHELVRHRLDSFAQESTRYCNYTNGKFDSSITVIDLPDVPNMTRELIDHWHASAARMEKDYFEAERIAKEAGISKPAEICRMWLPIGLKAEICIGANTREWRHIFEMRCSKYAHPIIRGIMLEVLKQFAERMPHIYADLSEKFLEEKDNG